MTKCKTIAAHLVHSASRKELKLGKMEQTMEQHLPVPAVLGLTFRKEKEKLILVVSQPFA